MYTLISCFLQSLAWSSSENLLQGNIGLGSKENDIHYTLNYNQTTKFNKKSRKLWSCYYIQDIKKH